MLFLTHLLLGIVSFLLIKGYLVGNQIVILLLILLGSILPDIDEENSWSSLWHCFQTYAHSSFAPCLAIQTAANCRIIILTGHSLSYE